MVDEQFGHLKLVNLIFKYDLYPKMVIEFDLIKEKANVRD